jgi:hypothetical protein
VPHLRGSVLFVKGYFSRNGLLVFFVFRVRYKANFDSENDLNEDTEQRLRQVDEDRSGLQP